MKQLFLLTQNIQHNQCSRNSQKDSYKSFFKKVGYVFFQKRFKKNESGQVPKQTCSQSAVRVVSIYDVEERAQCTGRTLVEPSDRKIEMADKKNKRKTSTEQKSHTVSTPKATVIVLSPAKVGLCWT